MVAVVRRPPPRPRDPAPLRRFALVIGSNNGGGERERLRYAGHDAATIADVLQQLGGVEPCRPRAARASPSTRELDDAFDALSKRVRDERKRGQRVELVVYYSGHADETGILIGGAHYDYARLRERIRAVPGRRAHRDRRQLRVGQLHAHQGRRRRCRRSCATARTRSRASRSCRRARPTRTRRSPTGSARRSSRTTSSSALRGAADRNHDGKITLSEAYQFSYEQTLGRTQNTVHGPQHPAYDMHLSGTGDVVITDLRSTDSALVLPPALRGHVTIVDTSGRVAVELTKDAGEPLSLALPNETYSVRRRVQRHGEFAATVTLDRAGALELEHGGAASGVAARRRSRAAVERDRR